MFLSYVLMENRITLDVNPVVRFCGYMATQAILLVISCDLLIGCVGLKKRPTPTVAPERVVWVAALCVLDQDKPHFCIGSPVSISSAQLRVVRSEDLLHQHSAVSELTILPIVFGSSRRGPGVVQLIALRIEYRIGTDHLIQITKIDRLAYVARLVNELESVERLLGLRVGFTECSESSQRENESELAAHLEITPLLVRFLLKLDNDIYPFALSVIGRR